MRRLRRWYIPRSRTTSVQGPAPARGPGFMTDAAGCEPHRPSSRHWRRRLVQTLQQQYMFHRKLVYSLPVYQEFASLWPPLGGRTRLIIIIIIITLKICLPGIILRFLTSLVLGTGDGAGWADVTACCAAGSDDVTGFCRDVTNTEIRSLSRLLSASITDIL